MKFSRLKWFVVVLAILAVVSAWLAYEMAAYDACLDRINYDRTRWHVCD